MSPFSVYFKGNRMKNRIRQPSVLGRTARSMGCALDSTARAIGGQVTAYGCASVQDRMGRAEQQPTIAPPHGNVRVNIPVSFDPNPDTLPDQPKRRSVKLKDAPEAAPEIDPNTDDPLSQTYQSPALIPTKGRT